MVAATPVTTHCLHKNILSHLPAALRACTTTSTGMSEVSLLNSEPLIKEGPLPPNHPISLQWDTIEQDFGVQRDTVYQAGIHPGWLEVTKMIGETIVETDAVTVGETTVDEERSEKQTKTTLRLVGYHGVGSVRK